VKKLYIDGGSRGNPGSAAIGFVVFESEKREIFRYGEKIENCTNNIAEYRALIAALVYVTGPNWEKSKKIDLKEQVVVYSDSELLVKQINRHYRVRSVKLIPLFKQAIELMEEQGGIEVKHVARKENHIADWIVNRVLDNKSYS
jgi:ribonuclease HI